MLNILPVVLLFAGIAVLVLGWRMQEPAEKGARKAYRRFSGSDRNDKEITKQGKQNIPEKYLKIKELHEQGYSNEEISKKLGINQGSVKLMIMKYSKEHEYENIP
jgi:DNA-binding NarL/FixJ family response regulator